MQTDTEVLFIQVHLVFLKSLSIVIRGNSMEIEPLTH